MQQLRNHNATNRINMKHFIVSFTCLLALTTARLGKQAQHRDNNNNDPERPPRKLQGFWYDPYDSITDAAAIDEPPPAVSPSVSDVPSVSDMPSPSQLGPVVVHMPNFVAPFGGGQSPGVAQSGDLVPSVSDMPSPSQLGPVVVERPDSVAPLDGEQSPGVQQSSGDLVLSTTPPPSPASVTESPAFLGTIAVEMPDFWLPRSKPFPPEHQ